MTNSTTTTIDNLLARCKQIFTANKLSLTSRKLYLADIRNFLLYIGQGKELTISTLGNPRNYQRYLDYLKTRSSLSAYARSTAALRQLGKVIAGTYSVANPADTPAKASSGVKNDYIKYFTNYLNASHLSNLTIKSYKSDVTRYLSWIGHHHPSNNVGELLKEKNLELYLDHLSKVESTADSTLERKIASLTRFRDWYLSSYGTSKSTDSTHNERAIREQVKLDSRDTTPGPIPPTKRFLTPSSIISFSLLFMLLASLVFFGYRQFARDRVLLSQAAFPDTPTVPNRQLSFQGRLEHANGTPVAATPTDFIFTLYTTAGTGDPPTGGTNLYSASCTITTDNDGVFNTQIGSTCGSAIPSTVFTENSNVWLAVNVEGEDMGPRQQIATVAYALNSETLQGFPLSSTISALKNTIVPMNQWGEIVIGEQSPKITGVAGTLQISAPALSIITASGTNGNISIAPDGTGQVNITGNTTSTNFFNVSNAQLTTGSLITGTAGNDNTGFNLIDLFSGSSPTSKFSVTDAGNTTMAGDLTITGDDLFMGTNTSGMLLIADGTNFNPTAVSGDITINGSGATAIGSDKVTEAMLKSVNSPTDELCLSYESTVGDFEWQACGGAAGTSNWRISNGAISPINDSLDFLVGGEATASAKFAVLNVNPDASGTPTASVSAGTSGAAFLTADGYLSTTQRQDLTLGNSASYDTTGNILLNPNGTGKVGIGTASPDSPLSFGAATGNKINFYDGSNYDIGIQSSTMQFITPIGDANARFVFGKGTTDSLTELMRIQNNGNVGIGDNTPLSMFTVGNGDLFQVNSSGIVAAIDGVAHTIDDVSGNLTLTSNSTTVAIADGLSISGTLDANGQADIGDGGEAITLNGSSITLTGFNTCTALETDGSGVLSCGSDGGGSILWQELDGTLSPTNSTWDLLVGGTSTSSAKFAVLNVNPDASGTPTASVSAGTSGAAFLTADGYLSTTQRQDLTLGNSASYDSTGNILLNPNGTGKVGIGTATPLSWALLDVRGDIYSSTSITADDHLRVRSGGLEKVIIEGNGVSYFNGGNVGIGDATPASLFTIGDGDLFQINSSGIIAAIDGVAHVIDDTSGDLQLDSAGGDIYLATGDNLHVSGSAYFGGGTTYFIDNLGNAKFLDLIVGDTANPGLTVGDGSVGFVKIGGSTISDNNGNLTLDSDADLILEPNGGKVAVGHTSPVGLFDVKGAVTGKALAIFDETGNQDIIAASASGVTRFRVATDGHVYGARFVDTASSTYYLDPAATGTSLIVDGNIVSDGAFSLTSNATDGDITIDAGAGTVIIGDGSGKLNAGTVDPPYTINGEKFATYMAGMTGVKEETTGIVQTNEYISNVGYRTIINFAELDKGTDLWLFSKVTNLRENIAQLVVLLSPMGNTKVWYQLDPASGQLQIYSSTPANISYRLTAPRFDYANWTNTRTDSGTGFVLTDPDQQWGNSDSPLALNPSFDIARAEENVPTDNHSYNLVDSTGNLIQEFVSASQALIANLEAGSITTQELHSPVIETNNLTTNTNITISRAVEATNSSDPLLVVEGELEAASISARLAVLDEVKTNKLYADEIVAGKITAGSIDGLDARIASLSAGSTATISDSELESITDRIKSRIAILTGNTPSAQDLPVPLDSTNSAALAELPATSYSDLIASDSATLASLDADFVTINDYLAVIGQATITSLDVTGGLFAENISSKTDTLALQPSGGTVNLAANTLIVDSSGQVAVNGDLTVSGRILADAAEFNHLSLGSSEATPSALGQLLAVYNEQGEAVATIDASGSANLASVTTKLITIAAGKDSTPSGLLSTTAASNSTAGEGAIISPNTELTIESSYITPNSLVYLTPTTNTDNKVLFVKAKSDKSFTVAIDSPAASDISFNWWIIELTSSL